MFPVSVIIRDMMSDVQRDIRFDPLTDVCIRYYTSDKSITDVVILFIDISSANK